MCCILGCDNADSLESVCANTHYVCMECYDKICDTLPYELHPVCPLCRSQIRIIFRPQLEELMDQPILLTDGSELPPGNRCVSASTWRGTIYTLKDIYENFDGKSDAIALFRKGFPKILTAYYEYLDADNKERFDMMLRTAAKEMYFMMITDGCVFNSLNPIHDILARLIIKYREEVNMELGGWEWDKHDKHVIYSAGDLVEIYYSDNGIDMSSIKENYPKMCDSVHVEDQLRIWKMCCYLRESGDLSGATYGEQKVILNRISEEDTSMYRVVDAAGFIYDLHRGEIDKYEECRPDIKVTEEFHRDTLSEFLTDYCGDSDADCYSKILPSVHDGEDYLMEFYGNTFSLTELNAYLKNARARIDYAVYHPAKWSTFRFYGGVRRMD